MIFKGRLAPTSIDCRCDKARGYGFEVTRATNNCQPVVVKMSGANNPHTLKRNGNSHILQMKSGRMIELGNKEDDMLKLKKKILVWMHPRLDSLECMTEEMAPQ